MKLIIRYIFILIHILAFFVLGCFVAVKYNMELSIDKSVVPMFFQVFIANLASSVFLMLSNLLFGLGLLGVTYLAFSLGIQFYTVVLAYGANNLLSIVSVLSIHGIFEIARILREREILTPSKYNASVSTNSITNTQEYQYNGVELLFHNP